MTYHHNRRLKAHLDPETTISPAQYLVAVFVADEIRANTSEFSISLNRLAKEARLSYATAQRSITALVKANILEIIRPHTRYTAPIYRLGIVCPDLCGDLRDHNTQQELVWIEALRKPQHTFKNSSDVAKSDISFGVSATYINKRDEEDITILQDFVEGSLELAILLDLLKQPKTAIEEEILVSATKHPKTMSQTLLGLLPKSVEGEKRIRAYLAKVLSDSPERLKLNIELLLAQQSSSHLIATSSEEKTAKKGIDLPDYQIAITKERFNSWITSVSGVKSDFRFMQDFFQTAQSSQDYADPCVIGYLAKTFEPSEAQISSPVNKQVWFKQGLVQYAHTTRGSKTLVFQHDIYLASELFRNYAQSYLTEVQETITPQDIEEWTTPDEKEKIAYTKQHELSWIEANPNARRHEYFGSDEYKSERDTGNLYEVSKVDIANRILALYNSDFNCLMGEDFTYFVEQLSSDSKQSFEEYLEKTFTLQDDLDILLKLIPERPEGHKKHIRKFATAYLELLATHDFSNIKRLLYSEVSRDYWITEGEQLQGDTYSLAPDKYLLKVVEDNKEPSWITKLREQAT